MLADLRASCWTAVASHREGREQGQGLPACCLPKVLGNRQPAPVTTTLAACCLAPWVNSRLAGHRILALNRGEKEKFLTVKVEAPEEDILRYLEKKVIHKDNPVTTPVLKAAAEDSYKRLIGPAIEREIRNELTEKAEDGAIEVFGKNLHQLLMQPPITGQVVLGWDPAFRTGCKLAIVDATGKVLDTKVIYPTAPQNKVEESKKILKQLREKLVS